MPTYLLFVPLLVFLGVCIAGFVAMWIFAKRTKITSVTTKAGEAVHMETPLGTMDLRPEATLDPRLASIPIYPSAMSAKPGIADEASEWHFRNIDRRDVTAAYWTPDPPQMVEDFYRGELPNWTRNLISHAGWELVEHTDACLRMVRIYRNSDRTIIETSIKPPDYLNFVANQGPAPGL